MIKRGRWFLIASIVKKSYIENLAMLTKRQFPPLFQSRIDSASGAGSSRSHSVRVGSRHGQWLELVRGKSISKVQTSRTTLHYWASRMWPRAVPFTSGLCMAPPHVHCTSNRRRVGLSIKPKQTVCERKTGKMRVYSTWWDKRCLRFR